MPKKSLLTLLALALILGGGIFVWFQTKSVVDPVIPPVSDPVVAEPVVAEPQSIDTSDWKTYRNEEYGFEFRYPKELTQSDKQATNNGLIVTLLGFNPNARNLMGESKPGYYPNVYLYAWNDINNSYLKGGTWEGERMYSDLDDLMRDSKNTGIIKLRDVTVDGRKGYLVSMPGAMAHEAVIFSDQHRYYRIDFPEFQKVLNAETKTGIIKSFHFFQ